MSDSTPLVYYAYVDCRIFELLMALDALKLRNIIQLGGILGAPLIPRS